MKICIIATSEGKNLELAKKFKEYFDTKNVNAQIIDVVKLHLPLFTSSSKAEEAKDLVAPFHETLKADGFIFISPEYNGGPTPAFTNFIAWVSQSTKDWRETFNGKPAAIATHSGGGGVNVLNVMRLQLAFIGLNIIGRQVHTTMQRPLIDTSLIAVADELIKLSQK